jgi:hypothetical protein
MKEQEEVQQKNAEKGDWIPRLGGWAGKSAPLQGLAARRGGEQGWTRPRVKQQGGENTSKSGSESHLHNRTSDRFLRLCGLPFPHPPARTAPGIPSPAGLN